MSKKKIKTYCKECESEITEGLIFCPNCGKKIEKTSEDLSKEKFKFCPICGEELINGECANGCIQNITPKKKNSKLKVVLLSITLIVLIAGGSIFFCWKKEIDDYNALAICAIPDCSKKVLSNTSNYCNIHGCAVCGVSQKLEGYIYCESCYEKKNKKITPKKQEQSSSILVTPKIKCLNPTCNSEVASFGSYCSNHKCLTPDCLYSRSTGSNYCSSHKCDEISCNEAKYSDGDYCVNHKCMSPDCDNLRKYKSYYCYRHDN